MNRTSNAGIALLRWIPFIGAVTAACLTRPVATAPPNATVIYKTTLTQQSVDKLDLLFMIDNSPSMGDKQKLLAQAVPDLITRLVQPNCVGADKVTVVGKSDVNGNCPMGKPEFPPVHDMHIGIVTSSLGGRGGNQCDPSMTNGANSNLPSHNDDRAELINRGGDNEDPVPLAGSPLNFLTWYPNVSANKSRGVTVAAATGPEQEVGAPGMAGTLIGDFTEMIKGVHEHGCGYEAQNEAWYRFLVQPDPFDQIVIDAHTNRASLAGVDSTILRQRAKFLRPDSLLAVVVVTDENEEVADPLSVDQQGWLYESAPFPGSPTNGAPEGTIECKSNPNDPNCTSCAFSNVRAQPDFAQRCPDDPGPPPGTMGFLSEVNDHNNVRFYNQKQRFGVFAGYPIARYIRGLQKVSVPDRAHEVDGSGNYVGEEDMFANCVNPIFAQNLPTDANADLCHLQRGPRTAEYVYFAAIGGVPHELLQARAGVDDECAAGTPQADCPQKRELTDADWLLITGKDPEHWDFTGIDPHMLESEEPRAGLPCNADSNDDCDPMNGREWSTNKGDLEYACVFPLVDAQTGQAAPKDCTLKENSDTCDCVAGFSSQKTPLCKKENGAYTQTQINGKAYPSIREMAIAHAMATSSAGVQGIVSSLCPIHTSFANNDSNDPLYGYRPAANAIVNRLQASLRVACLPERLIVQDDTGKVDCLVLVTLPTPGDESVCASGAVAGLGVVDPAVLELFRASQEADWVSNGGVNSGSPEPNMLPVCALQQLTPKLNAGDFDANGSCVGSTEPGWCYLEGQAAGECPQQIVFTSNEPPSGSRVSLQCFEKTTSAVAGGT